MRKRDVMAMLALSAGVLIGASHTQAHAAKICIDGTTVPEYVSCPDKLRKKRPVPHQAGTADAFASGAATRHARAPQPSGPSSCLRPGCVMNYKPNVRPK